ncbi:hypothetical protein [Desulfosporosinus sp. FKA]|nr:hypothetical protein [Desulfosporosinus sp. FKA]
MGSASQTGVNRSAPSMSLPLLKGSCEREMTGVKLARLCRYGEDGDDVG